MPFRPNEYKISYRAVSASDCKLKVVATLSVETERGAVSCIAWLGLPVAVNDDLGVIRMHYRFSCKSINAGSNESEKGNQQCDLHAHQRYVEPRPFGQRAGDAGSDSDEAH